MIYRNTLYSITLFAILSACGGGSGDSNNTNHAGQTIVSDSFVFVADDEAIGVKSLFFSGSEDAGLVKLDGPETGVSGITHPYTSGRTNVVISPDRNYVAYLKDDDGDPDQLQQDLYVARIDQDTAPVNVSNAVQSGRRVFEFKWSPDSERLVYRNDFSELFAVNIDGSQHIMISGEYIVDPFGPLFDWAPDGSRFSFVGRHLSSSPTPMYELLTVNPDGSNLRSISGDIIDFLQVYSFKWSSDSSKIAYIARKSSSNSQKLYIDSPDGTETLTLSNPGNANARNVTSFDWSADENYLAYSTQYEGATYATLSTVRPDGTENTVVARRDADFGTTIGSIGIDWAPISNRLLLSRELAAAESVEFYMVTTNGTEYIIAQAEMSQYSNITWSPDERHIGFIATMSDTSYTPELYIVPTSGGDIRRLSHAFENAQSGRVFEARWSPSGQYIAYKLSEGSATAVVSNVRGDWETMFGSNVFVNYYWAPDNRTIAYIGTPGSGLADTSEFYSLNVESGEYTDYGDYILEGGRVSFFEWR